MARLTRKKAKEISIEKWKRLKDNPMIANSESFKDEYREYELESLIDT